MAKQPTNAELQAQLETATKRADDAEAKVAELNTALTLANERADQERKRADEATKRVGELETEVAAQAKSLRAYKGSATKARNEAEVLKRERSPEARKVGELPAPRNDEEAADRAAALEAAFAGGPVELVFSDGRREIRELEPRLVTGDAWRVTARGRILTQEIILEPGTIARPEVAIAGIGLLNEDGEQVGWRQLPERILVASGTKMRLAEGTIVF